MIAVIETNALPVSYIWWPNLFHHCILAANDV